MWKYCSREDVAQYVGISEDRLEDSWSEEVEDMIDRHLGESFQGATSYSESYDGDGSDTLFLKQKPVNSVTSLSISGTDVTASEYKVYQEGYIRLVSSVGTPISEAIYRPSSRFPVGQQNVAVVYSASSDPPARVRLAAKMMISSMALVHERGGAQSSLALSMSGPKEAGDSDRPTWSADISGRLRRIMRNVLGARLRFA
jgi:hypothetical protein